MTIGSCPQKHRAAVNSYVQRDILGVQLHRGREYISIRNEKVVTAWIRDNPIEADPLLNARASSILLHKDSKSGKALDYSFLQFRSINPYAEMTINQATVNIAQATAISGCSTVFSGNGFSQDLGFNAPLYLIENLECWANAEKYLPNDGIYLFYQGWLSNKLLGQIKRWAYTSLHISPDYDLVGLHNWLKLKQEISGAQLFMPVDLERLLQKHPAEHLWIKQKNYLSSAEMLCKEARDPTVSHWLMLMQESGACLEQEALLIAPNNQ
ncbi:MAG: hypothetical protein RSG77_21715 [Hafnia sp.]